MKGPDLIKPDGSKLYIVGTNLGNWLNPEGYMFGFQRMTSPRLINEVFSELVGPYKAAEFWKAFKDNYITEKDIAFIAVLFLMLLFSTSDRHMPSGVELLFVGIVNLSPTR